MTIHLNGRSHFSVGESLLAPDTLVEGYAAKGATVLTLTDTMRISGMPEFVKACQKHKIKPMLVLFDSVWDPDPRLGPQRAPRPGVHNSGWVQSPGAAALSDEAQYPRLQAYVEGVVGAFGQDERVLAWDIWNEPDNTDGSSYG